MLPGFGLTFGFTTFFLSAIVLIPLAALISMAGLLELARIRAYRAQRRGRWRPTGCPSAPRLLAATINLVFGFILAWTLVRYDFPGRKLIDALIDLPFALPTAVSGIALTTVFAQNGWLGHYLALAGIKVAYTWIGVTIALTLIGMPFMVRTVQPALAEVQRDLEDAAETLGANRFYVFRRIILPIVVPGHAHRLRAGLRARRRRIRLGDLHRRQSALQDRDHARCSSSSAWTSSTTTARRRWAA